VRWLGAIFLWALVAIALSVYSDITMTRCAAGVVLCRAGLVQHLSITVLGGSMRLTNRSGREGKGKIAGIMVEKNSDRWTQEEDDRLRRLLIADTSPSEIAEMLGRTVSAVKARAYSLGLTLARFGIRRRGMSRWG